MADIKTGIFAKNVQKRLNRAQEKVLQKLGKADETKDEQFEQIVINFKRQEFEGSRLQREMKAYMTAIKGMQQASINLTESLHEVYEPDWHGKDDVMIIGKDCDALWEDFHNKLVDSTLLNLDGYLLQFPDLKNRVAKRSRKLIDYDSARHHLETLQASGIRNDRKMMKAEDELKKAQKVFDELNVGLQDELPTLWDSRVGFYITTFKSVTSLEARFHREISLLCKQLYEVMTKLSEQHSDKMFTIQGAPSDSGPLRLARTPSPPDDETPPESPDASSNHMLRPVSPGPPRPKSPSQLKKGPPVPPPPKVTPTKEVAQEQIIDLFGGEFLPAPSPSQPNERPGESLLDLDFDAFQPDESVSPIPQTALPWDVWSGNAQPAQPPDSGSPGTVGVEEGAPSFNPSFPAFPEQATDAGFVADWSADFGSAPENGDTASTAPEAPATGQEVAEAWPPTDGGEQVGDTAMPPQPQDSETATPAANEVSSSDPNSQTNPNLHFGDKAIQRVEEQQPPEAESEDGEVWTGQADSGRDEPGWENRRKSTPGLIFTNEYGEQIEDMTEGGRDRWSRSPEGSASEYETCEEWADGGQGGGWASADDELASEKNQHMTATEPAQGGFVDLASNDAQFDAFAACWPDPAGKDAPEQRSSTDNSNLSASAHQGSPGQESAIAFTSNTLTESLSGFAESSEGGGLNMDIHEGGGFDKDPFAESEGAVEESVFTSDPFAETQEVVGFNLDPFEEKQLGDTGGGFKSDPFGEASEDGGFVVSFTTDPFAQTPAAEGTGWGDNLFVNSFPAASSETGDASNAGSWQEVSDSSGFFSTVSQEDFASFSGAEPEERVKDKSIPRAHKDPENSDMSEDEAANRRFGKLYQELDTEKEEVTNAFNGFSQDAATPSFFADFDKMNEASAEAPKTAESSEEPAAPPVGEAAEREEKPASTAGSPVESAATEGVEPDQIPPAEETSPCETAPSESVKTPEERKESPVDEVSEKMPIPSVVIEPASSNEGDDDRDADIISPTAVSDNGVTPEHQVVKDVPSSGSLPDGFMYKVETMHDFEAANSDELELKRGDVVLVVPTVSAEDQDAGWLTGIKESDWLTLGIGAQSGLFPDNFVQRLE
ncbi:amphiphysin isoform X3 [Myripristis murdjan]|uniref:amphiphysin isoform X3 n=1 Tax=Myripristis murdjan TaxID=586833 RepID=UPI001175D23C|nr:amphiphysin isoform X3 [Myripristis murdjan]